MNKKEIEKHKLAAGKLDRIKDEAFFLIGKNIGKISEYQVNEFILKRFKEEGLVPDKAHPSQIVAADTNTSFFHYFPPKKGSKTIQKNQLVLLDIWA